MKGYLQWQLAMPKGGLILGKKKSLIAFFLLVSTRLISTSLFPLTEIIFVYTETRSRTSYSIGF